MQKCIIVPLAFAVLAVAVFATAAYAAAGVTYPVIELGNCTTQGTCRAFCDAPANRPACLEFAAKNHLLPAEDIARFEKFSKLGRGPGGCATAASCETYCNSIDNAEDCITFAERNGLWTGEKLKEAKQIRDALRRGVKPPGDCRSRETCESYCADPLHIDECILFGRAAGFISEAEARDFVRMLPLMKSREAPNGCLSRASCEAFCDDERNTEECVAFAQKAGFLSTEEADRVRRIGGRGPGGCRGRNECGAFCEAPENQQACFDFAAERGLIPEEDRRRMEEGARRLEENVRAAPPEVQACIGSVLGADNLSSAGHGGIIGGPEAGVKLRKCFELQEITEDRGGPDDENADEFMSVPEEEQSFNESESLMSREFADEGPPPDDVEENGEPGSKGFLGALLAPFVELWR
ncbi:MAG: hypothetical protein HYT22_04160 [Candidatus Niyogibacteria bacterium]|nr:hypothetical protein [Candidatus Niyogibacteria bacterium]